MVSVVYPITFLALTCYEGDKYMAAPVGKDEDEEMSGMIARRVIFLSSTLLSSSLLGLKEPHPYDALHDAHVHSHAHGTHPHEDSHSHSVGRSGSGPGANERVSDSDMDKLRSTLKQFVRDWSAEVEEKKR